MSLRLFWDEQFNTACEEYFDVSGWDDVQEIT